MLIHVSQEVFPSASVNKDDFCHCENVVSHMIEPSYGRNLKSTVFSSWETCYVRQCVDKTVVSNDLRLFGCKDDHVYTLFSPRCFQFLRNIE